MPKPPYPVCSRCRRPLGLAWWPKRPKLCDRCYAPRLPEEAERCPYRRNGLPNKMSQDDQ